MQEEKAFILKSHQSELSLIKREAENKIRVLQNLTNKEKDPFTKLTSNRAQRNPLGFNPDQSSLEIISLESSQQKNKKKRTLSSLHTKKIEDLKEESEEFREEMNPNNNIQGQANKTMLIDFLKLNLNESLERENKLMEKLDQVLKNEAKKMREKIGDFEKKEIGLRPEVERWMMRCQELAQKYEDALYKMSNMSIVLYLKIL